MKKTSLVSRRTTRLRHAVTFAVGFALCMPWATARPVRSNTADELANAADVICNGTVEYVKTTDEKTTRKFGGREIAPLPMLVCFAKIKVTGTIKGTLPDHIMLRFPSLAWESMNRPIVNGPNQIHMQPGNSYRFYLKASDVKDTYVGVTDGNFDDSAAVEALDDAETPGSPPLLKAEAEDVAIDYVRRLNPKYSISREWVLSDYSARGEKVSPIWSVRFYSRKPYTYPAFASDAEIRISPSRQVDANSWVSAEIPKKPGDDLSKYEGKEVRMNVRRMMKRP